MGRRNKKQVLKDIHLHIKRIQSYSNSVEHFYNGSYPFKSMKEDASQKDLFSIDKNLASIERIFANTMKYEKRMR